MEGGPVDAKALVELVKAASGSGSIWVTSLVSLVGAVLLAHRFGLFSFLFNRTTIQAETLIDRTLAALESSHRREDELQAKLEAADKHIDQLREEQHQLRFEVYMTRQQLKMVLQAWRQAKAGAIPIDAVPIPEMPGEAP